VTGTLAISTSTAVVGVAVGTPEGLVAEWHSHTGRRHGEVLAPAIESLARLSGLPVASLGRVVVDVGPGMFTGLRVGVATAKALASALGVAVVACSSLDVLAHAHRHAGLAVASVVDARRGEVFWALYEPSGGEVKRVSGPQVCAPEALAEALTGMGQVLATGDGARRYAGHLSALPGVTVAGEEHDHPRASVLLALAGGRDGVAPESVNPLYVRGPDVRIGWERRDG
jgi:tRNA threonylcarbamoyladenosine biosynthesis protein TsaB